MRQYVCDSCGDAIKYIHEENAIEFGLYFSYEGIIPKKKKVKIHLCRLCFEGLHSIGEKALKERSEGE